MTLRYTLRTLLILLTILAILVGGWAERGRRQARAMKILADARSTGHYDFQFKSGQWSWEEFDGRRTSPAPPWLLQSLGPDYFHRVLSVTIWRHEDLRPLATLRSLEAVFYRTADSTDEDLRQIAALPELRYLKIEPLHWVSDSPPPAGWGHVTDHGLACLAAAPKLATINLQMEEVSDTGLFALGSMRALRSVTLRPKRDMTTPAGREQLRRSLQLELLEIQTP